MDEKFNCLINQIKPIVLSDKNRDIMMKVNDGPYWNQSSWNLRQLFLFMKVVDVSSHSFVCE